MVDDKQFILGKAIYEETSWVSLRLSSGFFLSFHDKLNVWHDEKCSIVLLGNAWQVNPDFPAPIEELKQIASNDKYTHNEVYSIEKSWCGRYLLIVGEWIYLDTIGSLGCFYSNTHVSSSLHVLCRAENRTIVYPDITHGHSPDFIPGMKTCYDGVRRLIPSQIYNYVTGEIKTRPLLPDGAISTVNDNQRIEMLEKYFTYSLQNMASHFHGIPIWLSLTGGRDSRAALAMLEKSGIKYHTFTLWHEHITSSDVQIPLILARRLKKEHRYIHRSADQYSQQRYDDYRAHTAGMAVDEDWNFYAYNQYASIEKNAEEIVILRNSIWENVNDYYSIYCNEGSLDFSKFYPYAQKDALLGESLQEWYSYTRDDIFNQNISIWNRILWELRTGCWLSSIEQSFDLMDGITSIQPCNCRLFLSLLIGFDQRERVAKTHEEKIVNKICPILKGIPYDYQYIPKQSFVKIIRRKVAKAYKTIKSICNT